MNEMEEVCKVSLMTNGGYAETVLLRKYKGKRPLERFSGR